MKEELTDEQAEDLLPVVKELSERFRHELVEAIQQDRRVPEIAMSGMITTVSIDVLAHACAATIHHSERTGDTSGCGVVGNAIVEAIMPLLFELMDRAGMATEIGENGEPVRHVHH